MSGFPHGLHKNMLRITGHFVDCYDWNQSIHLNVNIRFGLVNPTHTTEGISIHRTFYFGHFSTEDASICRGFLLLPGGSCKAGNAPPEVKVHIKTQQRLLSSS